MFDEFGNIVSQGGGNGAAGGNVPPVVVPPVVVPPVAVPPVQIARVSVRAPPFWKEDPALWFIQLESQFHTSAITVSETKYHIAVAALDTSVISQISDLIMNPPVIEKYEALKRRLQSQFADSEEHRLKKLLGSLDLGDKKPSHLWREMKNLAGNRMNDNLLRSLRLNRLPTQTQAILSVDDREISLLLVLSDKLHEIVGTGSCVNSISGASANTESSSSTSTSSLLEQLCTQMSSLTKQIASLTSTNAKDSFGYQQRNRTRSMSRSADRRRMSSRSVSRNAQHCWYHSNFGSNAKRCVKPCSYANSTVNPEN